MRFNKNKAVAMLLTSVISASMLCGCTQGGSKKNDYEFYFSDGNGLMTEKTDKVLSDEIADYEPLYADAMSTYFKDRLTDSEKCVYNSISYAVDNAYTCVYIPQEYFTDINRLSDIITFYSCDSPFLEHNYADDGQFSVTSIGNEKMGFYTFNLPRNTDLFTREKMVAYNRAKEYVEKMPVNFSNEFEKAGYLYDYIAENVRFATTTYNFHTVPIYDTVVSNDKTAICDGFSDTVTLLFNLAGIEAFSVEGTSKDGGHVLNMAKLDGQYYYFDSSADSNAVALGFKGRFYYAMSEKSAYTRFVPEKQFEGLLPEATVNATAKSADITTVGSKSDVSTAAAVIQRDGSVMVAFANGTGDKKKREFVQELADKLGKTVTKAEYNGLVGYSITQ